MKITTQDIDAAIRAVQNGQKVIDILLDIRLKIEEDDT